MARQTKPLTNTEVEKAKPKEKDYLLFDGQGLQLLIKASGGKFWQFRYYRPFSKKRALISLGVFPELSLQQARQIRDEYRSLLANNIDPQQHRQQQEQAKKAEIENTFERIAWQWFEYRKTKKNFSADYQKDVSRLIEMYLLPAFGGLPMTAITAPLALKAFKPLQESGKLETLKRSIQKLNEIMTYAVHREIIPYNPTANIKKEFDSPTVEHFKTIKPEELAEFLYTLNNAQIKLQTRYLILWQLLTMTRPAESSTARYDDIDEKAKIWTIRVKKGLKDDDSGRIHKITLSRQALALLREIKKLSGGNEFLFPSVKNPQEPMNSQTANGAIKRMGFKGKLVAHGMRSIASTYLNDKGYNSDAIEVALSHMNSDRIKASYDRGERLEMRFEILQAWGDFVEQCSSGALPEYHLKRVA
ncbi:integrase arm-type DNA-binding domain-containing protein [Bibersteinia trehalosi]|uniref:integrase arm-type DNA-binding domain-containing protein n=1 Tax=Bibersteinia trehalosi TaxID=47735 RepID=UPI003D270A74